MVIMGAVHNKSDPKQPEPSLKKEQENENDIIFEDIKARVDKIHIDGLSRTKNDIIEDCIGDLFKATNFQEVLIKAHQARQKLDDLCCFKNIGVFVDTSKGPGSTPDGLEVTFNVKEFNRLTGGVSTQVGNNEGAVIVGIRAPNMFGRGERIQFGYSYGSKKTTNFNIAFIKPLRGVLRPTFTTRLFQDHAEFPTSGYKQLDRGLLIDFGFQSSGFTKHNIQWEAAMRDLSVLSRTTSFDIREESGITLKSSLRHILSVDFRDDVIFPLAGSLLQVTSEVAGLGGDVGFYKNDIYIQGNTSFAGDFVLQGCLSAGIMAGLSNDLKISLCDRYYLGGPLTIRGFQMRGVGPHSDGDALGALGYWASGLHLFTPLPFRPGKGGFGDYFRCHLFLTAGNIGNFKLNDPKLFESLSKTTRISYGLGLAMRLGNIARLEVNYCFPYAYEKGDHVHPGIQFGIGVQFL